MPQVDIDLLSNLEAEHAKAQGWMMCHMYEPERHKARPAILPLTFTAPFNSVAKMENWVINRARQGDQVAIKALRLVMQGMK